MLPLLRKLLVVSSCCILGIALPATSGAGAATTTLAANGATVTKIKLNGQFAELFLLDPVLNAQGALVASKNQLDNTSGLDFSYISSDPANPDQVILLQGAGEIANSAFTISSTTAHLALTTPASYSIYRCVINIVTGDFSCAPGTPSSFDLTWVSNGIGSVSESTTRVETLGPLSTKFKAAYTSKSAVENGTWDGHNPPNLAGNLLDTHSTTFTREITVQANP